MTIREGFECLRVRGETALVLLSGWQPQFFKEHFAELLWRENVKRFSG
ncbi:hypothetical protein SDC9_143373 [bioreactor metagenome]|uniref:Uncharacterized protein n=1 Tax=bioreactor metagenome TaxID=1076179 RepID=A0A645E3X2_9ZZZZ